MAAMTVSFTVVLCYSLLDVTAAGERCTRHRKREGESHMMYCDESCCGDVSNRYCCDSTSANMVIIVIGCIAAGLGIVCVVVAICCWRRKAATGRVLTTRQAATRVNVTVGQPMSPYTVPMPSTTTTALSGAYSHGYAQPPVTPPYAGGAPQEENKPPPEPPPSYEETMRQ